MKKMYILFIVLAYIVACTGCVQTAYSLQLKQAENEVSSISFVNNEKENQGIDPEPLLVINAENEINQIVVDLLDLEIGKHHNDPPTSYGKLYIEICYKNGDIEIIGTEMFAYTSTDGKIDENYGGWYYVKMDSMRELFSKYTASLEICG